MTNKLCLLACMLLTVSTLSSSGSPQDLPKLCLDPADDAGCERIHRNRVVCRKDLVEDYYASHQHTRVLILCSWSLWYLDPIKIHESFPNLHKLVVRNGSVAEILTDFPAFHRLEELVLTDLILQELRPDVFSRLNHLKFLDLSRNRLKHLHPSIISHLSLSTIILNDNPWNCSDDFKWILDSSLYSKVENASGVLCGGEHYPGKPIYLVMSLIKSMENECPTDICECSMPNIVWDTDQSYLVPVIVVNCSSRGLQELPAKLPRNTTTLVLENNNITDLLPLVENEAYRSVADVYLDYNRVVNIDSMEGALWLKTFRVLSLKGNLLTQLPTYAFDNAFERNSNMVKIYLGKNPWRCDCSFTPEFQHLLIKYTAVIKDPNEITCAEGENEEISFKIILDLSKSSVCRRVTNEVNPLDILSGVLACLIVLVIGKLIYDYWTFKTTGKLPWIVAKMP